MFSFKKIIFCQKFFFTFKMNLFLWNFSDLVDSSNNWLVFFVKIDTEEQKEKKKWTTEKEKTFCAWGYKFEQYMSVQVPDNQITR